MENYKTVNVGELTQIVEFASKFKNRRQYLNFRQEDVADFCSKYFNRGMSQTTVSRFEGLQLRLILYTHFFLYICFSYEIRFIFSTALYQFYKKL